MKKGSFLVPATAADARVALTSAHTLITATEWQRAGIVAAFVRLSSQGVTAKVSSDLSLTPQGFADLGIVGLKSKQTVQRYVQAWLSLGQGYPEPGQNLALPVGKDFPKAEPKPKIDKSSIPSVAKQEATVPPRISKVVEETKARREALDPETKAVLATSAEVRERIEATIEANDAFTQRVVDPLLSAAMLITEAAAALDECWDGTSLMERSAAFEAATTIAGKVAFLLEFSQMAGSV